jgi:hypothetical protein
MHRAAVEAFNEAEKLRGRELDDAILGRAAAWVQLKQAPAMHCD